jgi:hypothetical protein
MIASILLFFPRPAFLSFVQEVYAIVKKLIFMVEFYCYVVSEDSLQK